jgi:CRP-like cAMP-binding protein
VLRRSLRTRITTRVLMLSATVAALLSATLIILIIAVTSQRDAGRTALRSQKALTLTSRMQTSLLAIHNSLRDYVARYPQLPVEHLTKQLEAYPGQQRALAREVADDRLQRARVNAIGDEVYSYKLRATVLIADAQDDAENARRLLFYPDTTQRVAALGKGLRELASRERALVAEREDTAESRSKIAIGFGLGGLGLVLVVVVGGTLYLRRAVVGSWPPATCRRGFPRAARTRSATWRAGSTRWPTRCSAAGPSSSAPTPSSSAPTPSWSSSPR